MKHSLVLVPLVAIVALTSVSCATSSDHAPVVVAERAPDSTQFNNLFQDSGMYFSGQPTEAGLEGMAGAGVTTVINLRTDSEMSERVTFDERTAVERLGMKYVHLPMNGETFNPELVSKVADAMADSDGKVLLHCASSNRVGAMWASYQNQDQGLDVDAAVERGKAVGLRSETLEAMVRKMAE